MVWEAPFLASMLAVTVAFSAHRPSGSSALLHHREIKTLPHCSDPQGSQHGWPVFQDESSLRANTSWATYFDFVYGEVPITGYPICMWDFSMLYKNGLEAANIDIGSQLAIRGPSECTQTGTLVAAGSEWRGSEVGDDSYYWISRGEYDHWWWSPSALVSVPMQEIPDDHWAEVVHCGLGGERHEAFYFHMPGSAVWLWIGKTKAYGHLDDIVKDMNVTNCPESNYDCYDGKVWSNAVDRGYDTLQLMETAQYCYTRPQIIDLTGTGSYPCGRENTKLKAGWMANNDCICSNTVRSCFNCAGVGHFGANTSLLSFANLDTNECLYSLSAPASDASVSSIFDWHEAPEAFHR